MSTSQYASKDISYYQNVRPDLIGMLPRHNAARVLDIGCGEGGLGAALKANGLAEYVVGIEPFATAARVASHRLDEVINDSIERVDIAAFSPPFDLIICADVLEHLVDPWQTLARISDALGDGGQLLISVPNVGHASVIWNLLRGRWQYQDQGLLDRTHLRFFTRRSILNALAGAGFRIDDVQVNRSYSISVSGSACSAPPSSVSPVRSVGRLVLRPVLARLGRDFVTRQFRIRATKPASNAGTCQSGQDEGA